MSLTAARFAPRALVQRILFCIQAFDQLDPPLRQGFSPETLDGLSQHLSNVLNRRRPSGLPVGIGHAYGTQYRSYGSAHWGRNSHGTNGREIDAVTLDGILIYRRLSSLYVPFSFA